MAKLQHTSISRRTVEALIVEKDTVFWDRQLPGFGVRVYPSGSKMYVVQTRARGKSTRVTVGRHGVLSAEQARQQAALFIARVKSGDEALPAPETACAAGPTVAELAARYLAEHVAVRCKPRTASLYRQCIRKYIVPELGGLTLDAVQSEQVAALHYRLHETPYMANRVVETLSRMFHFAVAWGLVPEGSNPCRRVRKYKEHNRERFLTEDEFRRLGRVLTEAEAGGAASVHAVAAIRLLMLTGCRRNEILELRWENVGLEAKELRLQDTKTGPRTIPLSPAAAKVLQSVARIDGSPWVIPGRIPDTHIRNLNCSWDVIRARADLNDVRLHDLRHSFASRALALGQSLSMIGNLLGHSQVQTTARYAHLARESVQISAAKIAESIGSDMAGSR